MRLTAAETEAEAASFADRDFPLDVIGLEPVWHTQAYPTTYEFSRERFPDPQAFIERLEKQGIRVNLWQGCMVHPDCPLGKQIRPHSGNCYGGWGGLIPDLSLPVACETVAAQHDKEHIALGISGYKLDECDGLGQWLWPDHAELPSGLSAAQLRQMYGVLFQKLTTELFRRRGRLAYGLVRASNAGAVSFPEVEEQVRDVMKLRIRLIPYLYSAFARYHHEGIPPYRHTIPQASRELQGVHPARTLHDLAQRPDPIHTLALQR